MMLPREQSASGWANCEAHQFQRKGETIMFARIVEFIPKPEKKEFVNVLRNEVLPILKKQPGFLEILPFEPETKTEKMITITFWAEKRDAERYEREVYPKVDEILKPYLITPVTFKHYNVETSLCEHFVEALTA
jgi:heme-degrading monooxygenase HmoA